MTSHGRIRGNFASFGWWRWRARSLAGRIGALGGSLGFGFFDGTVTSGEVMGGARLGDFGTGSGPMSSLASSSIMFGTDEGGEFLPAHTRGSA